MASGKLLISLLILALVATLAAATSASHAHAQSPPAQSPPAALPLFDLSLETFTHASVALRVTNNLVAGHPGATARNVQVKITPLPTVRLDRVRGLDRSAGVWTIAELPPGGVEELELSATSDFFGVPPTDVSDISRQVRAEIIHSEPGELPKYRSNNAVERWWSRHTYEYGGSSQNNWSRNDGDAAVSGHVLRNQFPKPGEQATFRIVAENANHSSGFTIGRFTRNLQSDVRVSIQLSDGLRFPQGIQAPGDTSFNPATGIWEVGDFTKNFVDRSELRGEETFDLPVLVTAGNIPLEERCLTAAVTAEPAFELEPEKRENDVVTICLGKQPPQVLREGEADLFYFHNCVSDPIGLCATGDHLKLLAKRGGEYLAADSAIVQVRDPAARLVDNNANSVNMNGSASWRTKKGSVGGLAIKDTLKEFDSVYKKFSRTLSLGGWNGSSAPGKVNYRIDSNGFAWFKLPSEVVNRTTTPRNKSTFSRLPTFLEFERLGTYVLTYDMLLTLTDDTTLQNSATYTFHVGPIAELAVWDGGAASPLAGTGERAYTIMAANHGPDTSPAVEVTLTGVPEGAWAVLPEGAGEFRLGTCADGLCPATWDLGRMVPATDGGVRASGRPEFPTLTLIAPARSSAANITATIGNTEDYSVVIDGTTHSANYFDYNADNDTDDIEARYGTGAGDVGTPRGVRAQLYPQPLIALLRWDEVEHVNLWPVTHYEVWASPETCQLPGEGDTPEMVKGTAFVYDQVRRDLTYCYYVRAVNELGVAGFWSEPAVASGGTQVTPKLSIRGGAAVNEGGAARFTVTAFPPPVDDITINYTVTQQGDFVTSGDLGQNHGNNGLIMDDTGRAVITVGTVQDEVDEANGSVTVTLNNGDGYTVSSASSGSVTVLDDETSTAYFAQVSCPDCGETVGEDVGVANVEVTVWPAPAANLAINYTIDITVTDAATPGDDFRINGSGRASGSVTVRAGESKVDIPLQVIDDPDSENAEEVVITIAAGEGYELGHSDILTYTLTIEDNDGPRAEFAVAESSPGEGAGTHDVTVNLSMPAPIGGLIIDYTAGGDAQSGTDYNISGLAGRNGSVTVPATQTSVNIPVSIIQDTDNEGDEELTLTLQPSPGSYTVGSAKVHKVTILDDDRPRASFASASTSPNPHEGAGTVNVRVNLDPAAPTGGLTLRYGVGGMASRNRDYTVPNTVTAAAGYAFVDIPVTITDDGHSEAEETVILTLQAGPDYTVGATGEHTLTIADNDPPGVAFARAEDSVRENAGTYRAVINLEPGPHQDITISYSIPNRSSAVSPADYDISNSGSVAVKAGSGRVEIPISITDDQVAERAETLILTLQAGNGYNVVGTHEFTLTIEDDDAPVVTFQAPGGSVAEDGGSHTVTVQLDRTLAADVDVYYGLRGSADGGTDYAITGVTDYNALNRVTVPAGQRTADITVTIRDDQENEADEQARLTLKADGQPYTLGVARRYILTIVDDDDTVGGTAVPVVSSVNHRISNPGDRGECQVYERDSQCFPTFYVEHGGAELPEDFELVILYVGGTATLNEDFEFIRYQLNGDWYGVENPPAAKGETFTLTENDEFRTSGGVTLLRISGLRFIRDGKAEGAETIEFQVVNGPGYTLREPTEFTVTIRD